MLALGSVWISLAAFLLAATMLLYRPAFTDGTVTLVLYFGSPGALCFAGLVLWAYRKEDSPDPGLRIQRLQAKIAIVLAMAATAIVYGLVIGAKKVERIEPQTGLLYNQSFDVQPVSDPSRAGSGLEPNDMQVTINGQVETLDDTISVADLLAHRKVEPIRVAVEINEDLVPRKTFPETMIRQGDRIEIVSFVGGG